MTYKIINFAPLIFNFITVPEGHIQAACIIKHHLFQENDEQNSFPPPQY